MTIRQFLFRDRSAPLDLASEDIAEIRGAMLSKIALMVGKEPERATRHDWYVAAALTLRDRVVHRWLQSERETHRQGKKRRRGTSRYHEKAYPEKLGAVFNLGNGNRAGTAGILHGCRTPKCVIYGKLRGASRDPCPP